MTKRLSDAQLRAIANELAAEVLARAALIKARHNVKGESLTHDWAIALAVQAMASDNAA